MLALLALLQAGRMEIKSSPNDGVQVAPTAVAERRWRTAQVQEHTEELLKFTIALYPAVTSVSDMVLLQHAPFALIRYRHEKNELSFPSCLSCFQISQRRMAAVACVAHGTTPGALISKAGKEKCAVLGCPGAGAGRAPWSRAP